MKKALSVVFEKPSLALTRYSIEHKFILHWALATVHCYYLLARTNTFSAAFFSIQFDPLNHCIVQWTESVGFREVISRNWIHFLSVIKRSNGSGRSSGSNRKPKNKVIKLFCGCVTQKYVPKLAIAKANPICKNIVAAQMVVAFAGQKAVFALKTFHCNNGRILQLKTHHHVRRPLCAFLWSCNAAWHCYSHILY